MARNIIIISALGLIMSLAAAAQQAPDTTRDLKLSGFVDMYYRRDFLRDPSNNRTSFTNSDNSFELGMASVRAEWSRGRVGMVADLGVGRKVFTAKSGRTRSADESVLVAAVYKF